MEKWEPPYVPAVLFISKTNKNAPKEFKSSGTDFVVEEIIEFLEANLK